VINLITAAFINPDF